MNSHCLAKSIKLVIIEKLENSKGKIIAMKIFTFSGTFQLKLPLRNLSFSSASILNTFIFSPHITFLGTNYFILIMAQTISPICTLSVLVAHNSNVLLIYYPEDTVLPLPLLLENTAHTFEIL